MFMEWVQFEVKYNFLILGVGLGDSNRYTWSFYILKMRFLGEHHYCAVYGVWRAWGLVWEPRGLQSEVVGVSHPSNAVLTLVQRQRHQRCGCPSTATGLRCSVS